ncbi:MAG: hypothetical protein K2X47_17660, partial [Bdellovibrionales bacterium]|nr:hypothetical protein [Bdellovibrionales bacterium]
RVTKRIAGQLKKIGLEVEFFPSSEKFMSKKTSETSPFAFSGRVANNIDPLLMFASFKSNSPYKFDESWGDPTFDTLFANAETAVTPEDRIRSLRLMSAYLKEKSYVVPLYESPQLLYIREDSGFDLGNQIDPLTLDLSQIQRKPK